MSTGPSTPPINVIDESNLSNIMLTAASGRGGGVVFPALPSASSPTGSIFRRGLAASLVRAGRADEAVPLWRQIVESDEMMEQDRIDYAGALIRSGGLGRGRATARPRAPDDGNLRTLPASRRMVADSNQEWDLRGCHFYEIAVGLTTRPANVLNNWGYSRLTRGDFDGAEELFLEAVRYDPDLLHRKGTT